jgi:hypothetical protein
MHPTGTSSPKRLGAVRLGVASHVEHFPGATGALHAITTRRPSSFPLYRHVLADMADDRQQFGQNLIRMWRVWRTAKEMMHDRVRCARTASGAE